MSLVSKIFAIIVIAPAISLGWIYGGALGLGTSGEGALASFFFFNLIPAVIGGFLCSLFLGKYKYFGIFYGAAIFILIPILAFQIGERHQLAQRKKDLDRLHRYVQVTTENVIVSAPPFRVVLPSDAFRPGVTYQNNTFDDFSLQLIGKGFSTDILLPSAFTQQNGYKVPMFDDSSSGFVKKDIQGGTTYSVRGTIYFVKRATTDEIEAVMKIDTGNFSLPKVREYILSHSLIE